MTKVDTAGMNTMVTPESTPGRDRGKITRRNTCTLSAPRSWAASMTRWSIFTMTEKMGSTIKGRKLYTMPRTTALEVLMMSSFGRPMEESSVLKKPLRSSRNTQE